jgi:hypothetical protein
MTKRFTSKMINRKGGETMKIFGLTLVLALVIGGAAVADQATIDVYPGWNQISCPLVPMNLATDTNPEYDYTEPYYAFIAVGDDLANYRLNRFEATNNTQPTYLVDAEFGKLLLGDGYQLLSSIGTQLSYTGIKNGVRASDSDPLTDMWISLPGLQTDANVEPPLGGGWHLVGVPFATDVPAYEIDGDGNVKWRVWFTDGVDTVNWWDAVDVKGWVSDTFYGLNQSGQVIVSYTAENFTLTAGQAYWFNTKKDNIAMIVKGVATATP